MTEILTAVRSVIINEMQDLSGGWGKRHGWGPEEWKQAFKKHAPEMEPIWYIFFLSENWGNDIYGWYNEHCEQYGLEKIGLEKI